MLIWMAAVVPVLRESVEVWFPKENHAVGIPIQTRLSRWTEKPLFILCRL